MRIRILAGPVDIKSCDADYIDVEPLLYSRHLQISVDCKKHLLYECYELHTYLARSLFHLEIGVRCWIRLLEEGLCKGQ